MTGNPSIEPARPLVLTKNQNALLGELVEIMGLVESMLIESAERVVDQVASQKIRDAMGGVQAGLWAKAITGRVTDARIAVLVPEAERELKEVADDRNSFIHALFEGDYVRGYVQPGYQTTSARRSKTGKRRSTGDLQSIRDRAAKLSCLIDQIANAVA